MDPISSPLTAIPVAMPPMAPPPALPTIAAVHRLAFFIIAE
jgi:hypothetical protein